MSESGEMKVSEVGNLSDIDFLFQVDLSFFVPYLPYHIKETLEVGGEAYVSRTVDGAVSGVFIYDVFEKVGTVYTRCREVFDYFYWLKPFDYLFAELKTELKSEIYDIYTVDLERLQLAHRFSHEISSVEKGDVGEMERFMALTHLGINRRWVRVALINSEKCFTVRLGDEIAGAGWVSLVNGVGRLHSLYVKPQFRRLGIGEDILNARLMWLKSMGAHSVFTEISRLNGPSANNVMKAQMKVTGRVFQYFRKSSIKKEELNR